MGLFIFVCIMSSLITDVISDLAQILKALSMVDVGSNDISDPRMVRFPIRKIGRRKKRNTAETKLEKALRPITTTLGYSRDAQREEKKFRV